MEKENITTEQAPKKKGTFRKILKGIGFIAGGLAIGAAAVAIDNKTGIFTKANTAVANTGKKAWEGVKSIGSKKQAAAPVVEREYGTVETRPQQNNNYQQKNWQREQGRPDNRPYNN